MTYRKKLIEVALPLDAINAESAREKSIRHGHPSTLHLWWARRPLAACRAVLFASLVDDPSALPDEYPTEEAQQARRQDLFRLIEDLVKWENSTNELVLEQARREVARSVALAAGVPRPESAEEVRRVLAEHAPPVLDPFCGGGSIPLEAQRLGLEAHGSDLNPVAVLITKALIEIPPKFAGQAPVHPGAPARMGGWPGATGLAEDVRYYGKWMRDEAQKRIGHLYPKVTLPSGSAGVSPAPGSAGVPTSEAGKGTQATVIAWLWARTVPCPNPACGGQMPLISSFWISRRQNSMTWIEPQIDRATKTVLFQIRTGHGKPTEGTVNRRGATCFFCATHVPLEHIRTESAAQRTGVQLMALVCEGSRGRLYSAATSDQGSIAAMASPQWKPETDLPEQALGFRVQRYGIKRHAQLFTTRQLVALDTFSDMVLEARERIQADAVLAGVADDHTALHAGGEGATAYADTIAIYLSFALGKAANYWSSLCTWHQSREIIASSIGLPALKMVWDFAEANPFSGSSGNWILGVEQAAKALDGAITSGNAQVSQADAMSLMVNEGLWVISTDPPYYDNIPYADLSDFFYVWLRHTLSSIYPELFGTLLVPKSNELIAEPFRHGDREAAKHFFEQGLGTAFGHMREAQNLIYPMSIFYAFKQAEVDENDEARQGVVVASTGWETMLEALLRAGLQITGTWPMRTEQTGGMREAGRNALASSIVLICRPRPEDADRITRREFLAELRRELPDALRTLQQGRVAPVDLAQASIGPGMAVFSRYKEVLEANGQPMRVRTALQLINQALDEVLAEQEGEFDAETRWAIAWFEQHGMNEGLYGDAETLSKAKNTSVAGMERAGLVYSRAGKVRLLSRDELAARWEAAPGHALCVWAVTQRLIQALDKQGETVAAALLRQAGDAGEVARDLAYRLYLVCERKGWAAEALAYNTLATSWSGLADRAAKHGDDDEYQQQTMF